METVVWALFPLHPDQTELDLRNIREYKLSSEEELERAVSSMKNTREQNPEKGAEGAAPTLSLSPVGNV